MEFILVIQELLIPEHKYLLSLILKIIKLLYFLKENHQTKIVPCVFCATAIPSTTRIVTSNTDERNWTGKTSVIHQNNRPFSAVLIHANPRITSQNNSEHTKICN